MIELGTYVFDDDYRGVYREVFADCQVPTRHANDVNFGLSFKERSEIGGSVVPNF